MKVDQQLGVCQHSHVRVAGQETVRNLTTGRVTHNVIKRCVFCGTLTGEIRVLQEAHLQPEGP